MNRQQRGRDGEERARAYLEDRGLCLVERNYRCRFGEIDLVMRDDATLVFVEVRLRRNARFGGALTSVDRFKRGRLIASAQAYLQSRARSAPARFDVIALGAGDGIEWVKNAFESRG